MVLFLPAGLEVLCLGPVMPGISMHIHFYRMVGGLSGDSTF